MAQLLPPARAHMFCVEHVVELGQRWARARRSALLEVLADPAEAEAGASEDALRERAQAWDLAETYRRVFDNSQRLGRGFARFHRHEVTLADLPRLLPHLGVPCVVGAVAPVGAAARAMTLTRAGCGAPVSALRCDYWREAVDGLVIGLTDGLRWTRHRSLGHGDAECVDLAYANPEEPLRFGFLPEDGKTQEAAVRARLKTLDAKADVTFLGVSEGVLLYELTHHGCGGAPQLKGLVESHVKQAFPTLIARELSPRAVLEPDAG